MQEKLQKLADSSEPVLLLGPSGAGKTVLAQDIHAKSSRSARPFIDVNCGAFAPELIAKELFGHVRGAFTNAHADANGLLAAAHEGTLFLDEIAELPMAAQATLLKAIEDGTFRPVGATSNRKSDFRLIAATNKALDDLVSRGEFREDLYYRIARIVVSLPDLRRRQDLPDIAAAIVTRAYPNDHAAATKALQSIMRLSKHPHAWPGNIRELKAFVAQAHLGVEEAEKSTLAKWSDAETKAPGQARVVELGSASSEERERYAGLISASLRTSDGRPKAGGSPEKARALATKLLAVFPRSLLKTKVQAIWGVEKATLEKNIEVLRTAGVIEDLGDAVAAVWPKVTASLAQGERCPPKDAPVTQGLPGAATAVHSETADPSVPAEVQPPPYTGGSSPGAEYLGSGTFRIPLMSREATSQSANRTIWGVPSLPSLFLGRDRDLSAMKERLGIGAAVQPIGILASVGPTVAALRGWAGVGKTALASVLAVDTDVATAFPGGVLWATLGPKPNLAKILATWGRELGTEDLLSRPTLSEIVETIRRNLRDRQFLLIVDDVWEKEHVEVFRRVCPPGCTLLVATRELGALSHLDLSDRVVYRLPTLSIDDGAELLRRLAPNVAVANPEGSRRLAKVLECLPLALHVAGRLLKEEEQTGLRPSLLLEVLENDAASALPGAATLLGADAPADRMDLDTQLIPSVGALLKASTDRLSELDRERFAFLGPLAPRPATFDLDAIKAVWACENPWPTIKVLVARGLLEVISDSNRHDCFFEMHTLLVMHARSLLG